MSDAQADRILNWERSLSPTERAKFFEIRSRVRDIIADTNKIRRDAGQYQKTLKATQPLLTKRAKSLDCPLFILIIFRSEEY